MELIPRSIRRLLYLNERAAGWELRMWLVKIVDELLIMRRLEKAAQRLYSAVNLYPLRHDPYIRERRDEIGKCLGELDRLRRKR
jgi:hypothetical protein